MPELDLDLFKRQLSEAEIEQRRNAARSRWEKAGVGVVAAAGAGAGTYFGAQRWARHKAEGFVDAKKTTRMTHRWAEGETDRRRSVLNGSYEAKLKRIRSGFTRDPESHPNKLTPVDLKIRQLRGEMAPNANMRQSIMDRIKAADANFDAGRPAENTVPLRGALNRIPDDKATQAKIEHLQSRRPAYNTQVRTTQKVRRTPEWEVTIKGESRQDASKRTFTNIDLDATEKQIKIEQTKIKNGQNDFSRLQDLVERKRAIETASRRSLKGNGAKKLTEAQGIVGREWEQNTHTRKVPSTLKPREMKEIRRDLKNKAGSVYARAGNRIVDRVEAARNFQRGRLAQVLTQRIAQRYARHVPKIALGTGILAGAAGYYLTKADEGKTPEESLAQRLAAMFRSWYDEGVEASKLVQATAPVAQEYRKGVVASDKAAVEGNPRSIGFSFAMRNPEVERQAITHQARLVSNIVQSQQQAITDALAEQARIGAGPRETAIRIRDSIGLTPNQALHVANFRTQLETGDPRVLNRALRDKRFDRTIERYQADGQRLPPERVEQMVDAYHRRYLAYRATTIARTEGIRAANMGGVQGIRQHLNDNPDMEVMKTWMATKDDRTRHDHQDLDGKYLIGIDTPFLCASGDRIRYPHDEDAEARQTINCRCTITWKLFPRSAMNNLG